MGRNQPKKKVVQQHGFETLCEKAARLCWRQHAGFGQQAHPHAGIGKSIFCSLARASWKQQVWKARLNVLYGGTVVDDSATSTHPLSATPSTAPMSTAAGRVQRPKRLRAAKAGTCAGAAGGANSKGATLLWNRRQLEVVAVGGRGGVKILKAPGQPGSGGSGGSGASGGNGIAEHVGAADDTRNSKGRRVRTQDKFYTLDGPRSPAFDPNERGGGLWVCEYTGHCVTKLGWGNGNGMLEVMQQIPIVQTPYVDRSKSPLATENLLENTDGVLRPQPLPRGQSTPSAFSRGGSLLLLFMLTTALLTGMV